MKKIIIINGAARSGKDTFVRMCSKYSRVENYSAVDGVKSIARTIGWDGTKDEKSRKFLSDLKDLADAYNDYSNRCIENKIDEFFKGDAEMLFIHMREPEQIQRFQEEFPVDSVTLLVTNNRVPLIASNHADANVFHFDYDQEVENNGLLEELEEKAASFVDFLRDFDNESEF